MQAQDQNANRRTWLAAARRSLVLDTPALECPLERADARRDAAKHLQQAAILAVRADCPEIARQLLATWEAMEGAR
jgi:hypothetical protein